MPHRKLAAEANMTNNDAAAWMASVERRLGEMGDRLSEMGTQVNAVKAQNDAQDQRLQENSALMMTMNKTLGDVRADTKPLTEMLKGAQSGLRTLGTLGKMGRIAVRAVLWGLVGWLLLKALWSGHSFDDALELALKVLK